MTHNVTKEVALPPVVPLRMRKPDGSLYSHPSEVEETIARLSRLSAREVVELSRIEDLSNLEYVPSECLVHFFRQPSFGKDKDALRDLFVILRQRVLQAVPVSTRHIAGSSKRAENAVDLEIREVVLHKFQKLLCSDREGYNERLDFYECRFSYALARLRSTARQAIRKEDSRFESMTFEGDTNEPSKEVEFALAAIRNSADDENIDFLYRSKLLAAIGSLPPDERRVIELLLQEVPIEPQDKKVLSIVQILGCCEKTVRNRRDRAYVRLHDALKEDS